MSNILDELTQDVAPTDFDTSTMGVLATAANKLIAKQQQINDAEEALKQLKAEERIINQDEIPQLMNNLGIEKLTLTDGRVLAVKESVQISIPAPNKPQTFDWMDKNGHGGLIKTIVNCNFARGDREDAEHALASLEKLGFAPSLTESVHAGTLKAWARIELEIGHSLPSQFFKVHVVKITTVK